MLAFPSKYAFIYCFFKLQNISPEYFSYFVLHVPKQATVLSEKHWELMSIYVTACHLRYLLFIINLILSSASKIPLRIIMGRWVSFHNEEQDLLLKGLGCSLCYGAKWSWSHWPTLPFAIFSSIPINCVLVCPNPIVCLCMWQLCFLPRVRRHTADRRKGGDSSCSSSSLIKEWIASLSTLQGEVEAQ